MLHLFQEHFRINHKSVSDQTLFVSIQNTGRYQVENELPAFHDKRVASVVTPLKSYDQIRSGSQKINDLSFSFITPLGTHNDGVGHHFSPMDLDSFFSQILKEVLS
jgi:hypothetical protein